MRILVLSLLDCKTLARKKKNTELVDILTVTCGVKAVTSLGELLTTADSLEYREEATPVFILNRQKENAQRASVLCKNNYFIFSYHFF